MHVRSLHKKALHSIVVVAVDAVVGVVVDSQHDAQIYIPCLYAPFALSSFQISPYRFNEVL